MKAIDESMLELGRSRYYEASEWSDMPRDKDGFVILKPTANRVDTRKQTLTADIDSLEAKLRKYKEEKEKIVKYQKTDDYLESKKEMSKKKQKKKKESLLAMVFNNADAISEEVDADDEDDEENYKDSRKTKAAKKKEATGLGNTLDTTYGKRFAPVVGMLHDAIVDFDKIASDIERDLNNPRNTAKTMYRSTQIGNMISAKNSKLSAVKELASVAKVISDLEYKKEKDKKESEGSDSSRAVATMAAKILRGGVDDVDDGKKGKKKDKKDKKSGKSLTTVRGISRKMLDEEDEDESLIGTIQRGNSRSEDDQRAMAAEFAKTLQNRKNEIKLTPWEKNIRLEGSYNVMVLCDPLDPVNDWKYVAVSNKSGKILTDDDYKEVLPKKKKARMKFDINKGRATDLNSNRTYKLMYKD